MVDFNLYLITDRTQTAGRDLPAVVAEALEGGVRAVQLREKDLPYEELLALGLRLRALTKRFAARLLINGNVEIGRAVGADGVHLGISSCPVSEARRLLGAGRLIGYSAHSVDEALRAESDGADFVTFGPVYPTPSKAEYGAPLGVVRLEEAVRALRIPVFALGGVKKSTIPEVTAAGAAGVALISAIIASADPRKATEILLHAMEEYAPVP